MGWSEGHIGNGPQVLVNFLGNELYLLGNRPFVLGNGPYLLCNGPNVCTQFMNRVILLKGRLGWVVCLSWPSWFR